VKTLIKSLFPLSAALVIAGLSGCTTEELVQVTFPKGIDLHEFPVTFDLPSGFDTSAAVWEILPTDCLIARKTYAQAWIDRPGEGDSGAPQRKITFLWSLMQPSGGKTKFFIFRKFSESMAPAFTFEDRSGKELALLQDGPPVLSYIYGMNLKQGVPEDRRRSSYVHPVYGLDGEILSDDFPEDHYHHRGIFWTWPEVFVGRDSVSLWDIRGINQRFERWLDRETGPVFARLGVQNGWYLGENKVVDETVRLTVYKADEVGRMLDFEFTWEALDKPVTILGAPEENKGYGGFSFRFARFDKPMITTSGGAQSEDSNLLSFPWADLSARFGDSDKISGAALFDSERNIGFPNGWTLRHYGFLGVAWPGNDPYTLEPGQPVKAGYRVWVHRGGAEEGMVQSAYTAYATPAPAKVVQ